MTVTPADKRKCAEAVMQSIVKAMDKETDLAKRRRGDILYEMCREYLAWQTEHIVLEIMDDPPSGHAPDPVHQTADGEWYHWDETWADRCGPYATEVIAREALYRYALSLGGEG